jgi:hypothetical protein
MDPPWLDRVEKPLHIVGSLEMEVCMYLNVDLKSTNDGIENQK